MPYPSVLDLKKIKYRWIGHERVLNIAKISAK
jgi:hypothetical protein